MNKKIVLTIIIAVILIIGIGYGAVNYGNNIICKFRGGTYQKVVSYIGGSGEFPVDGVEFIDSCVMPQE